jgi:hypothetical protein
MDMHLQPLATACCVSGQPFAEGDRVASYLVRATTLDIVRYDVLEAQAANFAPEGFVACRWVQVFKPRARTEGDAARALKMSAENLFLTLADPANELNAESTRLVQFLALMLERKKLLRPKGRNADGTKSVFEHARTKQLLEVPAGELTPEFFVAVQEQLSVLVGEPKPKAAVAQASLPAS